jgi:hypothetical protein
MLAFKRHSVRLPISVSRTSPCVDITLKSLSQENLPQSFDTFVLRHIKMVDPKFETEESKPCPFPKESAKPQRQHPRALNPNGPFSSHQVVPFFSHTEVGWSSLPILQASLSKIHPARPPLKQDEVVNDVYTSQQAMRKSASPVKSTESNLFVTMAKLKCTEYSDEYERRRAKAATPNI